MSATQEEPRQKDARERKDARPEPSKDQVQKEVDRILDGSFPASDPPAWGAVRRHQEAARKRAAAEEEGDA